MTKSDIKYKLYALTYEDVMIPKTARQKILNDHNKISMNIYLMPLFMGFLFSAVSLYFYNISMYRV